MKVKKTGRVETQEGGEGKVEDRVPKREKRIYKELEVLCLCGLDKLHSIEKSHAKKKKKKSSISWLFYLQVPTSPNISKLHPEAHDVLSIEFSSVPLTLPHAKIKSRLSKYQVLWWLEI